MSQPSDYLPVHIFTLGDDGVRLNMNFICPRCHEPLSEHDLEVFMEDPPTHVQFTCPEIDGERLVTTLEVD